MKKYHDLLHRTLASDYIISFCCLFVQISHLRFNITFSYNVYSHMAMTQVTAGVLEILYCYLISYLNWDF